MLPDVSNEVIYDQSTVDELLQREKNGRPLLVRLFEIYLEETPRLLEELESAISNKDSDEIYDVIHQMKGSAAALGARRLFRVTEAVLPMCGTGAVLELEGLVARVEDESDAFVNAISGILSKS